MDRAQGTGVSIVRVRTAPSEAVVRLFKQAFPRHPASDLQDALAAEFLAGFARTATLLVARDASRDLDVGFLIGGHASILDRARKRFIFSNAPRLIVLSLRNGALMRAIMARMSDPKPQTPLKQLPYQLRYIAVSPQLRGSGVGTLLLDAFEQTLPEGAGYHAWTLSGTHGAEGFFRAHGFVREFALDGHLRMCRVHETGASSGYRTSAGGGLCEQPQ
jgi:GNAT superfamily N-acetyltransferase